jgi:hypothetical protein
MIAQQQLRRCFDKALTWSQGVQSENDRLNSGFVYFPNGLLEVVVEGAVARVHDEAAIASSEFLPWKRQEDMSLDHDNSEVCVKNAVHAVQDNQRYGLNAMENWQVGPDDSGKRDHRNETTATNKRRKRGSSSSAGCNNDVLDDSAGCFVEKKRRQESSSILLSSDLQESAAYSKRLEELFQGETVDFQVGDISLSKLLGGVPRMNLDTRL